MKVKKIQPWRVAMETEIEQAGLATWKEDGWYRYRLVVAVKGVFEVEMQAWDDSRIAWAWWGPGWALGNSGAPLTGFTVAEAEMKAQQRIALRRRTLARDGVKDAN